MISLLTLIFTMVVPKTWTCSRAPCYTLRKNERELFLFIYSSNSVIAPGVALLDKLVLVVLLFTLFPPFFFLCLSNFPILLFISLSFFLVFFFFFFYFYHVYISFSYNSGYINGYGFGHGQDSFLFSVEDPDCNVIMVTIDQLKYTHDGLSALRRM